MREAISQRRFRVLGDVRSVHGLQKKFVEIHRDELFRIESRLGIDELELVPMAQYEFGARFGAHADPIQTWRRFLCAVRLDGDLESAPVERIDRRGVELKQWLTAGAHDEASSEVGRRPP